MKRSSDKITLPTDRDISEKKREWIKKDLAYAYRNFKRPAYQGTIAEVPVPDAYDEKRGLYDIR